MSEKRNEAMGNPQTIRDVQRKILEIAKYIDGLCRRNGIRYFIMAGTALGAARHGGFIPWDDDLDIFMTPAEYAKFKAAFEAEQSDRFVLQEWRTTPDYLEYAKVRMNGTTFIESAFADRRDMHHGIYVDIMVLHKVPNRKWVQRWVYYQSKFVTLYALSQRNWTPKTRWQAMALKSLSVLPCRWMAKKCYQNIYRYDGLTDGYAYAYWMTAGGWKEGLFDRSFFDEPCDLPFEDTVLMGSRHNPAYLTVHYGDYMTPPAVEKRKVHAHLYDVERDYTEYVGGGKGGTTVLVTTMHQTDMGLYRRMRLQTDAVIGNQASANGECTEQIDGHTVTMVTTDARGTACNRNTAIDWIFPTAQYVLFADDDLCFYDGYEQVVAAAFAAHPDADAIKFNLRCVAGRSLGMAPIAAAHRASRREAASWGVWGLAVKADTLKASGIRFPERFGPGTPNYCGEDSIFLQEMFKRRWRVYAHPAVIADIDQRESTWFEGYTERYFTVAGMALSEMYPRLCYLLAVRSARRFSARADCSLSFFKTLQCYYRGIRRNEAERRLSESAGHQP